MEQIDPEYLRKHYAGLSDEALMAVDRSELVELAQAVCNGEVQRRGLQEDGVLPDVSTAGRAMEPPEPPGPRPRAVKWSALAACVTAALALAIPMWNFPRQIFALDGNIGKWGAIAMILTVYVFSAIMPVFYFAMYRNDGEIRVSRSMRWMAIAAATLTGIFGAAAIPGWVGSFQLETVLSSQARTWTIGDTSWALGQISNVAGIFLLVSLSRLAGNGSSMRRVATSRFLSIVTTIAVVAGGIVVVYCAIGIATAPWASSYLRSLSSVMPHLNTNWLFLRIALHHAQTALSVICSFAAPFVVWRGRLTPPAGDFTAVSGRAEPAEG